MTKKPRRLPTKDPHAAAEAAALRYVDDTGPGIRRIKSGKGFRYVGVRGEKIKSQPEIDRIVRLAIPPAWVDVWICPRADGHIQATGRDARGRKQYRYHARWREVRDETKYERMVAFGETLPKIRAAIDEALSSPRLSREKVLGAVIRLLELTLIRVGNEEYAKQNGSFGLTTLREDHVEVHGSTIHFEFRGKSGVEHAIDLKDRRLAAVIRRCLDLPGEILFRCVADDGQLHTIESADVNAHLRELSGADFSAKDFRTWGGTVMAAHVLAKEALPESDTARKRLVVAAVKRVARRLGNTPAVCRKCYIHPAVFQAHSEGRLAEVLAAAAVEANGGDRAGLSAREAAVLALLRAASAVAKAA